ncbi:MULTISPECIES: hypothetical protein [unclassified Methylophaga]|mgnify:CR=1 FL=1|jgi:hypothetical protein|uniref:hypothetical protein n=1 Tax=unclassified Methylophaga TaxID=2629249 RepID=UPI000ED27ED9|nr:MULTISPECIES: hypothetical protein [unclassified Methylophaga]HCC81456.1 hypothetical protein [Methylophaga sp.]|tara:strand:- start:920 stop:1369 length:450 start_codon:yes stop_codon:yes gene_type:complete
MCGGAHFQYGDEYMRMYFPNPKAMLPVLKIDGSIELLPWGRRLKQPGNLPVTGWAKIESIYGGVWERYFPKPVKIPVLSFMEKDLEGHSHWYDLQKGQYIQGLVARDGNEKRVYVVTLEPEPEDAQIHSRWPRVVQDGEESKIRKLIYG